MGRCSGGETRPHRPFYTYTHPYKAGAEASKEGRPHATSPNPATHSLTLAAFAVEGLVYLSEVFVGYVRIDLCRCNVGMTEERLD